jgi:hypothetical protein
MKIRVKLPEHIVRDEYACTEFVDNILLWGMETEMDIAFYGYYSPHLSDWRSKERYAVFTVEADYSYMFSLKWGATLHKPKVKNRAVPP